MNEPKPTSEKHQEGVKFIPARYEMDSPYERDLYTKGVILYNHPIITKHKNVQFYLFFCYVLLYTF